jgi:hypothetical protein
LQRRETFHAGPGPHPNGTSQKAHGGGGGGGGRISTEQLAELAEGVGGKPGRGGEVATLGAIYKMQGFNGKPTKVSEDELDRMIRDDPETYIELTRGIQIGSTAKLERRDEDIARDLLDGDFHYAGRGVFGNGSYFYANDHAPEFERQYPVDHQQRAISTAREFSGGEFREDSGAVYRAAIKREDVVNYDEFNAVSSRVFTSVRRADPDDMPSVDDLVKRSQAVGYGAGSRSKGIPRELVEKIRSVGMDAIEYGQRNGLPAAGSVETVLRDHGHMAAAVGIKAMYLQGESYTVVLDRSALTMADQVYSTRMTPRTSDDPRVFVPDNYELVPHPTYGNSSQTASAEEFHGGSSHNQQSHAGGGGSTAAPRRPIPPPPGKYRPAGSQRPQRPQRPQGVLPDVPFSDIRIAYRPRHPDGKADPGEIVWAKVPFEEDPTQSKDRPVLIIGRTKDGKNLVGVQLTSKGKSGRPSIGKGDWDKQGRESFLNTDRFVQVDDKNYRREGAYVRKPDFQAVADMLAEQQHAAKVELAFITAALQSLPQPDEQSDEQPDEQPTYDPAKTKLTAALAYHDRVQAGLE